VDDRISGILSEKNLLKSSAIRDVLQAVLLTLPSTEVRGLHVSRPSAVVTGNGYDFDNDEQSSATDPAFVESLEALFDGLPWAGWPDSDAEPAATNPSTMSPPIVVTVSTEALTDRHGIPRVHTRAIQTCRSAELYLPVSINRLVRLVRESNGCSVAEKLSQFGMDYGGLRSDKMQILTLMLKAMVEARRDLNRRKTRGSKKGRASCAPCRRSTDDGRYGFLDQAEFLRPRRNPWPRTTEEVDEELIHILTPGVTDAILEKNTASVADVECEVIRIDSD